MAIRHAAKTKLLESGLFNAVSNYDELQRALVSYSHKAFNDDQRRDRLGEAFEVFAEYFLARCGKLPAINIRNVRHTSADKYHAGTDFYARGDEKDPKLVQVKYRGEGNRLSSADLATFRTRAQKLLVPPANRVLFTNRNSNEVLSAWYAFSGGRADMTIIGRDLQEAAIAVTRGFWSGFVKQLGGTVSPPKTAASKPVKRDIVPGAVSRASLEGRSTTKPASMVLPDLTKSTSVLGFYGALLGFKR